MLITHPNNFFPKEKTPSRQFASTVSAKNLRHIWCNQISITVLGHATSSRSFHTSTTPITMDLLLKERLLQFTMHDASAQLCAQTVLQYRPSVLNRISCPFLIPPIPTPKGNSSVHTYMAEFTRQIACWESDPKVLACNLE